MGFSGRYNAKLTTHNRLDNTPQREKLKRPQYDHRIFPRAYGNDFAFISKEHLAVNSEEFNTFSCITDSEIEVEVHFLGLSAGKAYTIDKLEKLVILPLDRHQPMIDDTHTEDYR